MAEAIAKIIAVVFIAWILLVAFAITYSKGWESGYEDGKNFIPPMESKTDSAMVIYCKGQPMLSNNVKMQRDSVQVVIDNFMGRPKKYLLMTLKLVTKER